MVEKSRATWIGILLTSLVLSALGLTGIEKLRRNQGHHASVRDDAELWALHYAKAKRKGRHALALIGTSRMLYGIDPHQLQLAFPDRSPIMLANNGAYPVLSLKLLAEDPGFTGDVLMDIDGRGLAKPYFSMQPETIQLAKQGIGPNLSLNRALQSYWQDSAVIAQAKLGLPALMARKLFSAPPPQPDHVRMFPDRSAALDFQTPNLPVEAMRANFAQGVLDDYVRNPPPTPTQYLADLAPVASYLSMLRAKGARVWVFASPTNGAHRQADETGYPRAQYWDLFAREVATPNGACAINAMDVSALQEIELPDSSHIDQRDRARYTALIASAMHQCRFDKA
jgi:hypothetical protein